MLLKDILIGCEYQCISGNGGEHLKGNFDQTMHFKVEKEVSPEPRLILTTVYQALLEKGYNPINQLIGYLLSGDPAYITSHNDARNLIRSLERDEMLEVLLRYYLGEMQEEEN